MHLSVALKVVIQSPVDILKRKGKGQIKEGADADLILLDAATLELGTVFAKG